MSQRNVTGRRFWLWVVGKGVTSWRSYAREDTALRWAETYRERGCYVEIKGWQE